MKKNWIFIALCLGFIIAWQVFVVTPYNKKHAPVQTDAPAATTTAENPTTAASTELAKASPNEKAEIELKTFSTASKTSKTLSAEQRAQAKKLSLSLKRSVTVFPNGLIGEATFEDYKVRGKNADYVQTLRQGLMWTSTNPQVEACLAGLKVTDNSAQKVKLFNQAGQSRCELVYSPDAQKEGLVSTELSLLGFDLDKTQVVELKGGDTVGTSKIAEDHNALFVKVDGSLEKFRDKDLKAGATLTGKMDWISWGDKYFATVLIPRGNYNPNVIYGPTQTENEAFFSAQYPLVGDDSKNMKINLDVFFGVKDPTILASIHPTLYEAVDLGWMGSVARALLWALKAIYQSLTWVNLGNFGLAIIILTLIVRALFWPLNKKVFSSGQRMKELAPQIEKLKAKYKGDRSQMEQLNRETMALYKANNVNPLGSCLPLLLQMPIFIGLYGALSHSLDLYQAPFIGWIQDLSSPDRFYALPILWTATLLGYTFLNPVQPQQAGMPDMKWVMIAMNVFFGYLSKDWPSGLTLYLFISNLVGITQQFMFQRAGKKLQPIQEGA